MRTPAHQLPTHPLICTNSPTQPRIFVIEKEHTSLPDTLNQGHQFARGRFLTWVSADNVHYPHFLSTFASVLDDFVEVGFAVSDHRCVSMFVSLSFSLARSVCVSEHACLALSR